MSPDRPMTDQLLAEAGARNRRHGDGPRAIHTHITRPVVQQLAKADAHTVLDLGCGNGWFTDALERCGFDVTGVDRDEAGLRLAREFHPNLRLRRMDVMEPLDPSLMQRFDAVVAIDLVDHVQSPRRLVETALAALKPGGLLTITSTFHGYAKNLVLALGGRFDARWETLLDDGRTRFFSQATLIALVREFELQDLHFETIGRIPMFARSMLVSGRLSGQAG